MSPPGRAGTRAPFQHFSLSATDEEWEVVRANAARRRVSMARYLVELGLSEERRDGDGAPTVLPPGDERDVLEAMRVLPSLVGGGTDTKTLIEEMQGRVAVMFDAWAVEMARKDRLEDLRAIMSERAGEAEANRFVARIEALAGVRAPRAARNPERRSVAKGSPGQGKLSF